VIAPPRKARDLRLIDAIDKFKRERFTGTVWRVTREGRDPTLGAPSTTRWCNGTFDVLYASLAEQGALAEMHALLAMQPVFPSKLRFFLHRLFVRTSQVLRLPDLEILATLGVDTARYGERDYQRTQEIADAAYFLGFDALIARSARWDCLNAVLFTERARPDEIGVVKTNPDPIDWSSWRRRRRR